MSLSLKPRHLQRYKDVAALALKYRKLGLVPAEGADAPAARSVGPDPAELAADLETPGPDVREARAAPLRAGRPPSPRLSTPFAGSRTRSSRSPFAEVEEIVQAELGVRISKAFAVLRTRSRSAAASLGQVHRARAARRARGRRQGPAARHPRADRARTSTPSGRSPSSSTTTRTRAASRSRGWSRSSANRSSRSSTTGRRPRTS